jgi:LysR family transcriptional regulator, carnitine catabolism transcriptional activator
MSSMNLKYRQLKAFAMVVESGSFRGAADRLAVTQPSLSALVKELEQDVGVRLFERTTRRCELTQAGRAFHEDMQGALRQLEAAYQYVKDVGKGTRGRLSLAALPSLAAGMVTRALGEFRRTHPGVRIQLTEGKNDEILAAVRQGKAELAVGSMWQPDDELVFRELFQDRMMFVAPSGHPLEKLRPTLKMVDKYDLILMNAGPTQHALQESRITRPPAFEVEHLSTAISLVRSGLGISILPSSVKAVLNLDGLVCRPIEGPLAVRRLGLAVRRGSQPSAAAAAFAVLLQQAAVGGSESR